MSVRDIDRRGAGFTLVEVLIALAILALLSLLGYRAVASLSDTEARLTAEAEHWRALDGFFSRLEADCREAVPRDVRRGEAREPAWLGTLDSLGNGVLELSRAGPEFMREPGSAGQRIGYRVRDGVVEVLYWPALDQPADAAPTSYRMVDGVAALRLAYLDGAGAWRDRWPVPGEAKIPRALRIEIALANGETIERLVALQ